MADLFWYHVPGTRYHASLSYHVYSDTHEPTVNNLLFVARLEFLYVKARCVYTIFSAEEAMLLFSFKNLFID